MRILGRVINSIPDDDLRALAKPETDSAEAKRFYDTGRILLRDRDKLDEAIDNFIKAKDLDLNYAQAWAGNSLKRIWERASPARRDHDHPSN